MLPAVIIGTSSASRYRQRGPSSSHHYYDDANAQFVKCQKVEELCVDGHVCCAVLHFLLMTSRRRVVSAQRNNPVTTRSEAAIQLTAQAKMCIGCETLQGQVIGMLSMPFILCASTLLLVMPGTNRKQSKPRTAAFSWHETRTKFRSFSTLAIVILQ